MLYNVALPFQSVDKTLVCDNIQSIILTALTHVQLDKNIPQLHVDLVYLSTYNSHLVLSKS